MQDYNDALRLAAAPRADRAELFQALGGEIQAPEAQPYDYAETLWQVRLHGKHASGPSRIAAIDTWAADIKAATPKRATDGRPDCPYNGQAPVT